MAKGVKQLLPLQEFVGFITGFWGVLAGLSLLFPLSNSLIGALWIPPRDKVVFTTLATIGSLSVITSIFTSRDTIARVYFAQGVSRRWRNELLHRLKVLVTRGLPYCLVGLALAVIYYVRVPDDAGVESPGDYILLAEFVLLSLFLSAGFTLFAMDEYIRQGGVSEPSAQFASSSGPNILSAKPEIANFVKELFEPSIQMRFYREFRQTLQQDIQEYGDLVLVHTTITNKLIFEKDPREDQHKYVMYADNRIENLLKERGLAVQTYTLNYLKVDGKDVEPVEPKDSRGLSTWVYEIDVQAGQEVEIEGSHSYLSLLEDVYLVTMQRFTRKLVFEIRRNKELEYQILQIGGAVPTRPLPKKGTYRDTEQFEIRELTLPGRGFLVQWAPVGQKGAGV